MTLTLILFAIAVGAVWIKDIPISTYKIPLWVILFSAALISGVINQYLEWSAIAWIALFGLLAFATQYTEQYRLVRALHLIVVGAMALLLGLGQFSGFHNPDIVTNIRFTDEGLPFTQQLRIDGISAGIILLAVFCNPVHSWKDWWSILRKSTPTIFAAVIVIFGCGLALNYVSVDVKFIPYTLVFLITNLLFTCVIEESFFRGLLQENFSKLLANWRHGAYIALILTALIFGLVHYKGGLLFVGLATLAGLFYGYAKYRVKHIEAAILTHFSINTVHVIAFTYPNF